MEQVVLQIPIWILDSDCLADSHDRFIGMKFNVSNQLAHNNRINFLSDGIGPNLNPITKLLYLFPFHQLGLVYVSLG